MKCYALALAGMALVSANPASLFKSSPEAHGINAEPLANLADGSSVQVLETLQAVLFCPK